MEQQLRYTLGKKDRLKSRKAIEQLFKEGKSFTLFPFRILYILKESPAVNETISENDSTATLQAGFTVSSRHFKKATDRNRIKRLMREAWRLQKNELQLLTDSKMKLMVFLIYSGKELPDYKMVFEKTALAIKRLIKLSGEKR